MSKERGMKKLAAVLFLALLLACEPIPEVKLSGGNPPSFNLGGRTDTLGFFICCQQSLQPLDQENYIWEIRNNNGPNVHRPINAVYGIIPQGFQQIIPRDNTAPPPLVEGRKYTYWAQGFYGGKVGCFEIREGKALKTECENRGGKLEAELNESENLPSLMIKGDDYLYELLIYYVDSSDKDVGNWRWEYVWQIRPENEYKKKLPLEIRYGILPEGHKQLSPENSKQPMRLKSGIRYHYEVKGINSLHVGCFELINRKATKVDCP
jgi:hypothetical protein